MKSVVKVAKNKAVVVVIPFKASLKPLVVTLVNSVVRTVSTLLLLKQMSLMAGLASSPDHMAVFKSGLVSSM